MEEIVELRGRTHRCFKDSQNPGQVIWEFDSRPVHYQDSNGHWKEINIVPSIESVPGKFNQYVTYNHEFSVGFRQDGNKNKIMGIRNGYNNQFEVTISKIIINGQEINIPDKYPAIAADKNTVEHVINDYVSIVSVITTSGVRSTVKVNDFINSFYIEETWHIKGFKVANQLNGNEYLPDENNQFTFTDGSKTFYIESPRMWSSRGESQGIIHKLIQGDNCLVYSKEATGVGEDWLLLSAPPIFIDASYSFTPPVCDGYIASSDTTWSTARTGASLNCNTTGSILQAGANYDSKLSLYAIYRSFLSFDTTALGSSQVTSIQLSLYVNAVYSATTLYIAMGTQPGTTLSTSDFNSYSTSLSNICSISTTGFNTINLSPTIIVPWYYTRLCLLGSHDYNNTAPGGANYIEIASAENSTAAYRPKLVVVTSEAARTYVNISGTWRQAKGLYVNVGGTWRSVKNAYVNVSGTWRQVF